MLMLLVCIQAKAKIMVVRDIERDDIEYISKTLNCLPIAHVDHMKPEKLGHADSVQEMQVTFNVDHAVHSFLPIMFYQHSVIIVT